MKITVPDKFSPPFLFWLLPPVFDVLFLLMSGSVNSRKVTVSLASEPPPSFQPTPERLAFENTRQSAQAGDAKSQFKMGKEYEEGHWVENSDAEAINWYRKAANQGHSEAQCTLGKLYFTGHGAKRNYEEAYFWYSVAAKSGQPKEWADAMKRYLSAAQIESIEKRASEWTPQK